VVEATDGLSVESQNHWPSLAFDLGAINDHLAPVLVAGFYYKTFMWPKGFWERVYEPGSAPPPDSAGRRESPTRTDTPTATPIATCWWSAPARPASPPRSPPPRRARA
jgi:sarcosine oxidase subunit alpha